VCIFYSTVEHQKYSQYCGTVLAVSMQQDWLSFAKTWRKFLRRSIKLIFDNIYPLSVPSVLWRCWLGGGKGIRPVKNRVVICLERVADLHMAQLIPLPLTVSCSSKIQIGFTFLVLVTRVVPEKGPLNGCVCVRSSYVCFYHAYSICNSQYVWSVTSYFGRIACMVQMQLLV